MSEEKWINDVLNSLQDADRPNAPQQTFEGIQQRIIDQGKQQTSNYRWMGVAAMIVLVICSNVLLLSSYYQSEEVTDYEEEYPEIISNYRLYEDEW